LPDYLALRGNALETVSPSRSPHVNAKSKVKSQKAKIEIPNF
jgi:hypothetical protein